MSTQKGHKVLDDLHDHLEDRLIRIIGKKDAAKVAKSIRAHFLHHWGGQLIYFTKKETEQRNLDIYNKFDGSNHGALAQEYGLAIQNIYKIIKDVKAKEIEKIQRKLL